MRRMSRNGLREGEERDLEFKWLVYVSESVTLGD